MMAMVVVAMVMVVATPQRWWWWQLAVTATTVIVGGDDVGGGDDGYKSGGDSLGKDGRRDFGQMAKIQKKRTAEIKSTPSNRKILVFRLF